MPLKCANGAQVDFKLETRNLESFYSSRKCTVRSKGNSNYDLKDFRNGLVVIKTDNRLGGKGFEILRSKEIVLRHTAGMFAVAPRNSYCMYVYVDITL